MDSARGVAAIVLCRRNSSCNSSCDAIARNGRRTIASYFCCFECNSLFAIGCAKGCSKHVSSVVAAARYCCYCSLTPCRFHPFSKHPTYRIPVEPLKIIRKTFFPACNLGRRQNTPENATHPKTRVTGRSRNLRFRACCVFGCVLAPS